MAAATNKPGPVHYALVIFIVMSVVLGITTYMFFRNYSDEIVKTQKLESDNQQLKRAQADADNDIQELKKVIGINLDKPFDRANPQNQATVVAASLNEIATYGKDAAGTNFQETLRKMRDALDGVSANRDSLNVKLAQLEAEHLAVKSVYQNQVDNHSNQAKLHEREQRDVIGNTEEKITAKTQESQRLDKRAKDSELQLAEERDAREKERTQLNNNIAGLELRIDRLREIIDNLEKLSFETADGQITGVQHSNGRVLINLGEADFLKSRTTFSVYSKENPGVGRGPEDIKGKIEVTQILGPHLAEAKVIQEEIVRPILQGDLIYSPAWSPGVVEKISVIGMIDLDGDGRSDREQFHQLLSSVGCVIDNEVDDEGHRIPENGKITVETRFLVKGKIPDIDHALTEKEQDLVRIMNEQQTQMEKEARINGVRVIKLSDFLSYIGFEAKRRTFLPGQDQPYPLRAGMHPAVESGNSKDRVSNGDVSGAFGKKGQPEKPKSSNGDVSKAFGTGAK